MSNFQFPMRNLTRKVFRLMYHQAITHHPATACPSLFSLPLTCPSPEHIILILGVYCTHTQQLNTHGNLYLLFVHTTAAHVSVCHIFKNQIFYTHNKDMVINNKSHDLICARFDVNGSCAKSNNNKKKFSAFFQLSHGGIDSTRIKNTSVSWWQRLKYSLYRRATASRYIFIVWLHRNFPAHRIVSPADRIFSALVLTLNGC